MSENQGLRDLITPGRWIYVDAHLGNNWCFKMLVESVEGQIIKGRDYAAHSARAEMSDVRGVILTDGGRDLATWVQINLADAPLKVLRKDEHE